MRAIVEQTRQLATMAVRNYRGLVQDNPFRAALDIGNVTAAVLLFVNYRLAFALFIGLVILALAFYATDRAAARHYAFSGNRPDHRTTH